MLEDREVARLSQELGKLSEFEEQNKERMKEIAHILVQHYMHYDIKTSNGSCLSKKQKEIDSDKKETFH